jgi:hypothetical protein
MISETIDPVALIDRLDAEAIRAELDALYEREAALRAALRVARVRQRARNDDHAAKLRKARYE